MIKSIKDYQTIGIVGLAKNSGKTTTLNALIEEFHHENLGLTSIGLDGETLDQVNFLPKPKIFVYPNMVVATTKACLDVSLADYDILEETPFLTALGRVYIIKMTSKGTIMLAGPTANHEMNILLTMMKKYTNRVFVDGALSRKTYSAMTELDGIVLATGASFSPSMEETILKTKQIITTFLYPKTKESIKSSYAVVMTGLDKQLTLHTKNTEEIKQAFKQMKDHLDWVYMKGALTERLIDIMIELRIKSFKLIIEDPSKLMVHHHKADVFNKLDISVEVIKTCPLLMITVNPFRPTGDSYDPEVFKNNIKELSHIEVINVKSWR